MSKLNDMPNIGKELESQLIKIGIKTCRELIELGSKEAFTRIRLIDSGVCVNKLYALEGAIQGIRWYYLSQKDKAELKAFYDAY
ncbi:MAG: TfoX/Sxy family protein [Bacillota bacterium]